MKLSILGQNDQSKLNELYLLIAQQKVQSDDEAAQLLYNTDSSLPAYQKLRSKLKGRLVDMLFLVDTEEDFNDDATLAYKAAWRYSSAANLMLTKGAINISVKYAERALKLALTFEHIDLVMQVSKLLRGIYSTYLFDEEKFVEYSTLYQEYEEVSELEARVEKAYEEVVILSVKAVSNNEEIARRGEQIFKELEPILERYNHFSLHRYIRFLQVTYLLNMQAYEETIIASQAAIDFMRTKKMNLRSTLTGLLSHQLVCHTQLKNYAAGKAKLEECKQEIGNFHGRSFFKVQELGLMLFLHSGHYQDAYELTRATLSNESLLRQDAYTQESWTIFQAYIHYLIYIGKVKAVEDDQVFTRFRLGRFLNEVPVFSKDKRGKNIPILVMQILFNIAMERYDRTFDRIEAIGKYTSRYIKRDEHFRSNCFIKMLLQIPIAGFQRRAAEKYAQKYLDKLTEAPLEVANQPYEIEIIPYEDLWQLAVDSLA